MTVTYLTPHTLTPDEQSHARAAYSWALGMRADLMTASLTHLPAAALRDVALSADILRATALRMAGPSLPPIDPHDAEVTLGRLPALLAAGDETHGGSP